jgi:hypothetical protein
MHHSEATHSQEDSNPGISVKMVYAVFNTPINITPRKHCAKASHYSKMRHGSDEKKK